MTLLASELLCGPDATGRYNGGYAAPRTAALLERLAATNDAVRRLLPAGGNELEVLRFLPFALLLLAGEALGLVAQFRS